jgi:hypothetical protein
MQVSFPNRSTRRRRSKPAGIGFWSRSNEGIEDALYDSQAIRRFVGIDLGRQSAPDATTLLQFRHLLEAHQLTAAIFSAITPIWQHRSCSCAQAQSSMPH